MLLKVTLVLGSKFQKKKGTNPFSLLLLCKRKVSHSIYRSYTYHSNMKRVMVSLPDGIWKIIEKNIKGRLGEKESEVLRNIVIAYLSEKGYLEREK